MFKRYRLLFYFVLLVTFYAATSFAGLDSIMVISRTNRTLVDSCECDSCYWGNVPTDSPVRLDTVLWCLTWDDPSGAHPPFSNGMISLLDPDCNWWSQYFSCWRTDYMPIWWERFSSGCKPGNPLNCDNREYCNNYYDSIGIWLHFYDSVTIADSFGNGCMSAKFCIQVDDTAIIRINDSLIGYCGFKTNCETTPPGISNQCPYYCFDGGTDTLPSGDTLPKDLYLTVGLNEIEVCTRSNYTPYGGIIYRLDAHMTTATDDAKPDIASIFPPDSSFINAYNINIGCGDRCERVFAINWDSGDGLDVTDCMVYTSRNSAEVPYYVYSLEDTFFHNWDNFVTGLRDIDGGRGGAGLIVDYSDSTLRFNPRMPPVALFGWGMQIDSTYLMDLCGEDTTIIFDAANYGKWRYFLDQYPPQPVYSGIGGGPWAWPPDGGIGLTIFHPPYPVKLVFNYWLRAAIWDRPGFNVFTSRIPRSNIDESSLNFIVDGSTFSPTVVDTHDVIGGTGNFYNPAWINMKYRKYQSHWLNSGSLWGVYTTWKPKTGSPDGIKDKTRSDVCYGTNYMPNIPTMSFSHVFVSSGLSFATIFSTYFAPDTFSLLGEVLTDGYIEDELPYTSINEIPIVDTAGTKLKYRLNFNGGDSYLDEINLIRIASIGTLKVVQTTDGGYHSIGGLLVKDTECTICDTCYADTLNHFTVDTTGTLTVVFENPRDNVDLQFGLFPLQSFFIKDDTLKDILSDAGRAITVRIETQEGYDTLSIISSQMLRTTKWVNVSKDYIDNDSLVINLVWDSDRPYRHYCFFLDTVESNSYTVDSISLTVAIINGQDTVTAILNSIDSGFVQILADDELDLDFTYTKPGSDSIETVYLVTNGFFTYYDSTADSLEATVNITTDDITIEEFNSATAVSGAFIFIDNGTTQESGFTDGSGVFNPTADLDYTYDIYVYKIGYRPLKVQHSGTPIYDNEIWYSDIQLQGDVVAEAGDTLTILPGTGVWVKHTSAVWNYAYDLNSRVDIMAYGGHIQAFGTEDDPVIFRPTPGGSGLYQWAGILAKNGGSFDINWATIEYVDAVAGIQGGTGPGNCKLVHTRHIGNQGVYGDWRSSSAQDGWFQADTCYVEGRFMFLRNADSCWARACTLSASSSAHECFYVDNCSSTVTFDACSLYSYTSQGGRNMSDGKSNFIDCAFKGTAKAISQYGQLELNSSRIDAGNTSYGLYEANTSSEIISRNTIFENYSSGGVLLRSANDFGTLENPGHNCFLDSSAQNEYAIYNDTKESIDAEWNYFAWKRFACPPTVSADSTDEWCDPDSTKTPKIIVKKDVIVPREFALGNAVPNPFNSTVAIEFDVPKEAEVKLEVFNLLGKKVITLKNEELSAGRYRVLWDSRDASGHEMPSGTYLYRMRSGDEFEETKKMILIK